jgi:cytoskeletal protein RodZ
MAIDLNKNKGENSNSRFNLSKSGESSAAGNDKSQIDQPKRKFDLSKPKDNVAKTSSNELSSGTSTPKRKSNNRVFFVLLAIICVAALFWIFTNKENSSNNQDVAAVQPDLKEQITPVSQSTTNSGGENLKEAEISPTSNPSPEPAQTTESNPSGTELGNAPNTKVSANTDIPYKKDETYKVYQFPFGVSDYSQADPELDKLA